MASKFRKAIGAVKDQASISLAKVGSNHTSSLGVAVLKATTHDDVPMDDRYVYEIVQFVSSSKLSAAACARAIGKRIGRTRNWIVALKSLLLILRIFQDGDPYFPREVLHAMKRGAKILNLSNFRDDSNSSSWEFTSFVRAFALYLEERLECFLTGKLQRRYTSHKGKRESSLSDHQRSKMRSLEPVRDMKPSVLLDKISNWQRLLERAIETRPTGETKSNILVQTCLYAIVQETFDLYKDISDGLTLLLDSFFHLQYENCVSSYHACVKASKQYKELSAFYVSCKELGVGRSSEYPSVQYISEELMETLQEFLKDQSSFPTKSKSPNNRPLLLLPGTSPPSFSRHSRNNSHGSSSSIPRHSRNNSYCSSPSYSRHSRNNSHGGQSGFQRMSLEDLISATENGFAPSNSIALEDYSVQYDKQYQRDNSFRISESGSTRSLPLMNSMLDLVSLCDWPNDEDDQVTRQENMMGSSLQDPPTFNAFSDSTTQSMQSSTAFPDATTTASTSSTFPQANPSQHFPFMDEATPSSTQPPNTSWTDSFDTFPEVATPSVRPFQELSTPTTQYITDSPDLNGFSQTGTPQMQHSTDIQNQYSGFHGHDLAQPSMEFSNFSNQEQIEQNNEYGDASGSGWELAIVETPPTSGQYTNNFSNQEHTEQNNEHEDASRSGWELATVETTPTFGQYTNNMNSDYNIPPLDSLYTQPLPPFNHAYNQPSQPPSHAYNHPSSSSNHYNPFLQDIEQFTPTFSTQHQTHEPAQSPSYSALYHTFQATSAPTFSTQQQEEHPQQPPSMAGNDPFAVEGSTSVSEQMSYESMSQHNLWQQQQLWLQHQNKIMEKHMA